jgi:hypothetical protein
MVFIEVSPCWGALAVTLDDPTAVVDLLERVEGET